jgi:hypothetical protein
VIDESSSEESEADPDNFVDNYSQTITCGCSYPAAKNNTGSIPTPHGTSSVKRTVLALESLLRKALEPQKIHQVLMLVPVLIVAVVFLISYPALMLD